MKQLEEIVTIQKFHETGFKEKGSQFTGQAFPVNSEQEVSDILTDVKKKFYDATHHCYGYKLLDGQFKYSDDGEPSGTAGIRILNAIDHFALLNVLVIVIRYFGGTKLGVGPLGKAYYSSAESVLSEAKKITKTAYQQVQISTDFSHTSLLHKSFSDFEMVVQNTEYLENINFTCLIKPKSLQDYSDYITDKSSGAIIITADNEIKYF
jgi:uncharacterized YigZ family protein